MGRRLPPLIAADLDVAVDEHLFPGDEHIVENDEAVGLVEAAAQRIVERAAGLKRERAARIELQSRRVDRDGDADRMVLIAGLKRVNAAQIEIVRIEARGRELLRARDHDAAVALLDHAGVEGGVALAVRRFGTVDLGRHDRIGRPQVIFTKLLVEGDHALPELLAAGGEDFRNRREAAEEIGDMVRRAAHHAERHLRPCFRREALSAEIDVRAWYLIGPQHPLAGCRRPERHPVAHRRIGGDVEQSGGRSRGRGERRVFGDVTHLFAFQEDRAPVVQGAQIVFAGAHPGRALRSRRLRTAFRGDVGICAHSRHPDIVSL